MMSTTPATIIEENIGSGKTLLLVYEAKGRFEEKVHQLKEILKNDFKVVLLRVAKFSEIDWQLFADSLADTIIDSKLKNFSLISFGSVSSLTIHFYLKYQKLVRSIIFVDALTRPHPSTLTRIIDKIEAYLPMGLPFRSFGSSFNGKPFLQRVRCPCLVITTTHATEQHLADAEILHLTLPTAWTGKVASQNFSLELHELIKDFQNVAAKRPQKNLASNG
jgi:hypothetical protein